MLYIKNKFMIEQIFAKISYTVACPMSEKQKMSRSRVMKRWANSFLFDALTCLCANKTTNIPYNFFHLANFKIENHESLGKFLSLPKQPHSSDINIQEVHTVFSVIN